MTCMGREQKPLILKTWRIGQSSAQRSTMLTRKVQEQIIFLYWEDKRDFIKEWVSSGNAPKLETTDLPDTPLIKDYLDQYDSNK